MKIRIDFPVMIDKAKSIVSPSYTTLIASVTAWIASVVLIMFPTMGFTTTVYPPEPTPTYQFILLGVTTILASLYSAIMGYRMLKE
jgi:hypothetical protein